ncbi:DRTGG domain-containing protein [Eremococcus coleocola]|uniref:DRTGG domain protein n=1 Tax=Eremococcus coleocola ACS-139-V-Col8 TaxID=908337 RepID=E4KM04_9LACT|nr:DRTGG domain-containing protein [Eremococcus coleocola]EFR32136.1 DRTGG domain protein [Eremococcus coleocola ACS-139-V-Col8]
MASKHQQIIDYIKGLAVGSKISVRGLAKSLDMSQGTIYRAIKDAEDQGLVATIERVGTIRVEKRSDNEKLTFDHVLEAIQGKVLAGAAGLSKELDHFIIGAMTEEAIRDYFQSRTLMIVGNRENVQLLALENGLAVLVTGGFDVSQKVADLANQANIPVMSTPHDTFTVASIINRSMINQEIQQEILTVADIYRPLDEIITLQATDTVATFDKLVDKTKVSRFPVVNNKRLIGIVTAKDLINKAATTPIERVMTKRVVSVQMHMSVASVSQKMTWEDIDVLPVVDNNMELLGIVSRREVIKSLQGRTPREELQTYEDTIALTLNDYQPSDKYDSYTVIQPQMINHMGTISYGVLVELISQVVHHRIEKTTTAKHIIEAIDLHYFNTIQIGNELQFQTTIYNQTRRQMLIQVDVFHENSLTAKSLISCQLIDS